MRYCMDKILSFQKDHDALLPGLYFSSLQKGVATFDLRFKKPNAGDFLSPKALHSIEHMLATALRNGEDKENILYFGPMGCRTGFYLLTTELGFRRVLELLKRALAAAADFDEVPGAKKIECGNYLEHDLVEAKTECARYLSLLEGLSDETIAREERKQRAEENK